MGCFILKKKKRGPAHPPPSSGRDQIPATFSNIQTRLSFRFEIIILIMRHAIVVVVVVVVVVTWMCTYVCMFFIRRNRRRRRDSSRGRTLGHYTIMIQGEIKREREEGNGILRLLLLLLLLLLLHSIGAGGGGGGGCTHIVFQNRKQCS